MTARLLRLRVACDLATVAALAGGSATAVAFMSPWPLVAAWFTSLLCIGAGTSAQGRIAKAQATAAPHDTELI